MSEVVRRKKYMSDCPIVRSAVLHIYKPSPCNLQMKKISIDNHCKKLANTYFLHITNAPGSDFISQSNFPVKCIILPDGNDELQFEANLISIVRFDLRDTSSVLTIMSHGLNREDFIEHLISKNKNYTADSKLAAYIYTTEDKYKSI